MRILRYNRMMLLFVLQSYEEILEKRKIRWKKYFALLTVKHNMFAKIVVFNMAS